MPVCAGVGGWGGVTATFVSHSMPVCAGVGGGVLPLLL